MSVYVDPLIIFGGDSAPRCFRHKPSCHLYSDSPDELHAFAIRLGLKREWFQNDRHLQHYDLTEGKRAMAIKLGAMEHLVFSPIAHTHPIAVQCELPRGWDFWQRYDRVMIAASERVVVVKMAGWEQSRGIAGEIAIAGELGIPVEYREVKP